MVETLSLQSLDCEIAQGIFGEELRQQGQRFGEEFSSYVPSSTEFHYFNSHYSSSRTNKLSSIQTIFTIFFMRPLFVFQMHVSNIFLRKEWDVCIILKIPKIPKKLDTDVDRKINIEIYLSNNIFLNLELSCHNHFLNDVWISLL